MRHIATFILLVLFFPSIHYAQWSTSTRAESTLYVSPGFYPGIVTFDDGSSIVLGALQSYIFARKLDERGYYRWTPPVQVFHNDSSFITDVQNVSIGDWGGWTSDGDGGIILFWYDHRGAYRDGQSGRWMNNSIYAQRVDKFGIVRWEPRGVLVKGPESGLKQGGIVGDGQGGCILSWIDRGFDYPGAPNKSYVIAARYNKNASEQWRQLLDSSTQTSDLFFGGAVRAGKRNYLGYYRAGGYATAVFDTSGNPVIPQIWVEIFSNTSWRDSILFRLSGGSGLRLLKLGSNGDTVWNRPFSNRTGCEGVVPFREGGLTPDGVGGVFYLYSCQDTIYHFDGNGQFQRVFFSQIGTIGGHVFSDSENGLVIGSESGRAQRYSTNGEARWDTNYRYLSNAGNAEFRVYASDKKGGIVLAFWPLLNGIYVQHTGRDGHVGILTRVEHNTSIPVKTELSQNYPNPFNLVTNIEFTIDHLQEVTLTVYNLLGQEVRTLVHATLSSGKYKAVFEGTTLASGVYICRLATQSSVKTKRMLLLK